MCTAPSPHIYKKHVTCARHRPQCWWSEAAAVGDAEWLGRLIPGLESGAMEEIAMDDDMILPNGVAETGVGYAVNMNTREQKNFWKSLGS